ncbi:MAG: hypothetical protein KC646_15525 [Candidatus Cloacimonetes bacterium]|nr:hypothetical protein [Candidatus Cloacimonadota bacterium]
MQTWKKLGKIFNPLGKSDWMETHAQVPIVLPLTQNVYRIYFSSRDKIQRSQVSYIEIDIRSPNKILKLSKEPILKYGKLGYFDEHGVYPSSLNRVGDSLYLYYIGWNQGATYPMFYASIGLAKSIDNGLTFKKCFKAPILSRCEHDPWMVTAPFVLSDQDKWRMYYVSGLDWDTNYEGKLSSKYHIKYAESLDGVTWERDGHVCIELHDSSEANIARPFVILEKGVYKMWYSYTRNGPYQIGYAESNDGKNFIRKDEEIQFIGLQTDFDNEMMCYAYIFTHLEETYMVYNGNSFGLEGFGLAVLT